MAVRKRQQTSNNGVPAELLSNALQDPVWCSAKKADEWLSERGFEPAPDYCRSYPRALRDHAAEQWGLAQGIVNKWGQVNWKHMGELGIRPRGAAITRARFAAKKDT